MNVRPNRYDFSPMHEALARRIEDGFLVMAATVVLEGQDVVDLHLAGHRDREAGASIALDSIYRIYSNTKPITSVAAMTLWEAGKFHLDDPVEKYLPALSGLTVLREGATDAADAQPLDTPPTVRQLMCHNAGFSYGFLMESPVDALYQAEGLLTGSLSLTEMAERLGKLPLAGRPGKRFQYSVATDVLARLVEVWSGQRFGDYLAASIFEPLGMVDTGFHVPAGKHSRFCANYAPVDPLDPLKPGIVAAPESLGGGYLEPKPFQSGGGGLVSTVGDYTRFVQMLMGDGALGDTRILDASTLAEMRRNQLPDGVAVEFPMWVMPGTVFGLGFAIKTAPAAGEPDAAVGEYHWGGMAGTHSWMSPAAGIAGIIFTQRLPGFWHPFSQDFKRLVYQAVC